MSSLGKEIRLSRIFNRVSGNALIIALDHPIAHGPIREIMDIKSVLNNVTKEKPEAIIVHKGIAAQLFHQNSSEISLIIKISSFSPFHPDNDVWLTNVEEAVRLGADAVSMGIHVGGKNQPELLRNLGLASDNCQKYGMPLVVHAYPAKDLEDKENSIEHIIYAVRTAAELGADLVKTTYTGSEETFKRVVDACPVPVGIAGGTKKGTDEELFEIISGAIKAGARSAVIGRQVWGRENISTIMQFIQKIIHQK